MESNFKAELKGNEKQNTLFQKNLSQFLGRRYYFKET